jgi:excinuclease ABC subunit B
LLGSVYEADYPAIPEVAESDAAYASREDLLKAIAGLEKEMREAAKNLEFERAADLRDRIRALKATDFGLM